MDEKSFGQLRSAIKSYNEMSFFANKKKLKKLLLLATPQTRYGLLMSVRSDGHSAVHVAANNGSFHHNELLRCMLDGMTPLQKYNLLEQQSIPYGNNPLHLLATKSSPEVNNMAKYLLDGLDIQQRQKLILTKNNAGDTAIDRAYRHCASVALPNILLQATATKEPARAVPVAALYQQPYRVNPSSNYMNTLQGNERMTYGAEAPPSYTELPTSQDFVNPVERTHNSMHKDLTTKLRAAEGELTKKNLGTDV